MGCVPADLNEDGLIDLFVYYWGRTPIAFLDRGRSGTLDAGHYVARELVASGERWYTNAVTTADLDGDGHLDLVIGNYFQDGARILDASADTPDSMQHSMSRAYNGGRNRVFRWRGAATEPEPDVSFEEIDGVFASEFDRAWTLAIGAADLDGDLLPELYFANDFGPDRFYRNRSESGRIAVRDGRRPARSRTTPRSRVLGRRFVQGHGRRLRRRQRRRCARLLRQQHRSGVRPAREPLPLSSDNDSTRAPWHRGVAPYDDLKATASAWPAAAGAGIRASATSTTTAAVEALQATGFAKGDKDRWPELQELATANDELLRLAGFWPRFQAGDDLSGHHANPFFTQAEDGRFYDIAAELGMGEPQVSRGIATADVDGDGDLDFAVANQWEASVFYRNDRPARSDFLGLRLVYPIGGSGPGDTRSGHSDRTTAYGRPAIGASARVQRADGRVLVAQVDGGNGHSGVRSPELHFGLGDSGPDDPLNVEIRYRDRSGRPSALELELLPGWHTVVLPDQPAHLASTERTER